MPLPPAVILTGNLGPPRAPKSAGEIALALSRSLGRRGVPVYRFHPERSLIDLESRYCTHVPCPNLYDDEAGLVGALLAFARAQAGKPVLFPAADGAVEFVARNEVALGEAFALACAPWRSVQEIQDKQRLLEHAARIGVPIPDTSFPKSAGELDGFAATLAYPAVVKPLTSHHWKRPEVAAVVGGAKALVVNDADELRSVYRRVAPFAPDMMVQEIVPGEIDRLLTFLGYVGRDGRPLAGCVRKKLRQYPAGFGYCCLAETVRDPEIMELSIRLLTSLGYRGIAGVEFKRDPRTGQAKLIEINARAVRTTSTAIGAGVDLPWIAYQDLRSPAATLAPVFDYKVPVRWIHVRSEIRAAFPMIRRGELSFREWIRIFRGPTAQVMWAWDDPKPGILNVVLPTLHRLSRQITPGKGASGALRLEQHASE
jgi:predicted ATP-grasp superfamily ATP-dependent carboligase